MKDEDQDAIRDRLVTQARAGCYCKPYSKPCMEHMAYRDGIEDGMQAVTESLDLTAEVPSTEAGWDGLRRMIEYGRTLDPAEYPDMPEATAKAERDLAEHEAGRL